MAEELLKQITHIVGERIFWKVRLTTANTPTDLNAAGVVVSFRGFLNGKTAFARNFPLFDDFSVRLAASDLLDETVDHKLEGRFYFTFPGGAVRATKKMFITVKR